MQLPMKTLQPLTYLISCLGAALPSQAASVVQFPISNCLVVEGSGKLEILVQRQGNVDTMVGVQLSTTPITATPGADYAPLTTNLAFPSGISQRMVHIPILNDGRVGTTRTFKVSLGEPTGGAALGAITNLSVMILDNDKGLHFYAPDLTFNSDAASANIKVARGDDGDAQVTVDYTTSDNSALAGQDYLPASGTLIFNPGEVLKSFTVPLLNDGRAGTNRSFRVTLLNPTGGGVLPKPPTMTVTLVDTDEIVNFERPLFNVREEAGFVEVGIVRGANKSGGTVDLATSDGKAIAGVDYTPVKKTLHFAAGERRQSIRIPILQHSSQEPSKSFQLGLSNPTGGAVLAEVRTAKVAIAANDPAVGFQSTSARAGWRAPSVSVAVVRGSDAPPGAFTVDYQTSDLFATAGVDYQAVQGTLTFDANVTLRNITIPILPNPGSSGLKSFSVTLSNPSAGMPLGRATIRVEILRVSRTFSIIPNVAPRLTLGVENGMNLLNWEGSGVLLLPGQGDGLLQRADEVTGPWQDLPGAERIHAVTPRSSTGFYRIQSSRPTEVYVPSAYDGKRPLPLLLVLHWLGGEAYSWTSDWKFEELAETRGFFVCRPNGTIDATGTRFWNGPDFLGFSNPEVDDSGYLRSVIEEIQRQFRVDPKRIYATGYSSGGAMSHRLACEQSDLIAGIAGISGVISYDRSACQPTHPVNILQVQGTAEGYLPGTVADSGLPVVGEGAGAIGTVQIWAALNGCRDPVIEATPTLDLTTEVSGVEASVLRYTDCPPGGAVELWSMNGASHGWGFLPTPQCLPLILDWLFAHPKP